ncbi:MAG TPA: hypothetical protein VEJ63_23655, partial [Planctomycetota bacterium]|nr:hypothetical protein [Planctomycetota bacterium]
QASNDVIAEGEKAIKKIEDSFAAALKDEVVPPGNHALCYVLPEKADSLLVKLEEHWAERKIAKRVEQRGKDTVTIWSGLDKEYAFAFAERLKDLDVKAWIEQPSETANTKTQRHEDTKKD